MQVNFYFDGIIIPIDVCAPIARLKQNFYESVMPFTSGIGHTSHEIDFNLNVRIGESDWTVPYTMVISHSLTREGERLFHDFREKNKEKYNWYNLFQKIIEADESQYLELYAKRFLRTPLFELPQKAGFHILVHFLFRLDYDKFQDRFRLTSNFLSNLNENSILNMADVNAFSREPLYHIELLRDMPIEKSDYYDSKKHWNKPCVNLGFTDHTYPDEKIISNKEYEQSINSPSSLIIIPTNYRSSFIPKNEANLNKGYSAISGHGEVVFSGTYKECSKVFNTESLLNEAFVKLKETRKFFQELNKKNEAAEKEEYERRHPQRYERDYFDAMTDGQLGFYRDYEGDVEDIDTWSRG